METDINKLIEQYSIARNMHRGLSDKFTGMRVSVTQPLAGSAYADPGEVSEDLSERFGENARLVLDTFPSYITDLGKSIANKARTTVRNNAARVPSTNGYLVANNKLQQVEMELIALKGIEPSDIESQPEEIIEQAHDLIQTRMANRKGVYKAKELPVTFIGYRDYVHYHFDELVAEILDEYGDERDKIINHLPKKERVEKAKFVWHHYAEVPQLMMYGETSLRDILHQREMDNERQTQTSNKIRAEIEKFQDLCKEAVGSVQHRVRSEIAGKLKDFVAKLGQRKTYKRAGREQILPANITQHNLTKLCETIDSLTSEVSGVADNDAFYNAVSQFRRRLGSSDIDDLNTRQEMSEAANRIIETAFDDSQIDANTGNFYASLL